MSHGYNKVQSTLLASIKEEILELVKQVDTWRGGMTTHIWVWIPTRCWVVLYYFHDYPILGGRTYLWFCAWISHMVFGMMVFGPWYFVDLVKGTTIMF